MLGLGLVLGLGLGLGLGFRVCASARARAPQHLYNVQQGDAEGSGVRESVHMPACRADAHESLALCVGHAQHVGMRRARVLEARRQRKHSAEPRAKTDKVLCFEVRLAPEEEEAVLVQRVSHLRRHRFAR